MSARDGWDDWGGWQRDSGGLQVTASELVVTTSAGAEIPEYAPLAALLQRAAKAFDVELAFVSEWGGEPVLREHSEVDVLHTPYGRRHLERTAPPGRSWAFRVDAMPVDAGGGKAHGTLCFRVPRRKSPDDGIEGAVLGVARLIAAWFESAAA